MARWTRKQRVLVVAIALAAVGVRLIAIEQPFVDNWSWRESDVATIARNFVEHGFRFAHPQIDWAGNEPGYVGTEFPILPFVVALCYNIAGEHEWLGRIQAVMFFAASLPFFYLLVRRMFGESAATWALIFYSFAPLNIVASRAFMPDVPSLSLALVALYFFFRWIEAEQIKLIVAAAVLVSLALLIKLPTAVIGAPMLYLLIERHGVQFMKRADVWCFAAIALVPSALWYWHAQRMAQAFYPYHMFGAGGVRLMNVAWYWKIAAQTATSTLTPMLFVAAVAGLFLVPRRRYARLFHWWLGAMILFVVVVGWGNRHQWYQLPFVPIAAALAGCACVRTHAAIRNRRAFVAIGAALVLVAFASLSYVYAARLYVPSAERLRRLGFELNKRTPPAAIIIAAVDGNPAVFYYARRKGWHFLEKDGVFDGNPLDSEQLIADFDKLRARGATHLVFDWSVRWWLEYYGEFADHLARTSKLVEKTPSFSIYELNRTEP